jgi:hypothetical protein
MFNDKQLTEQQTKALDAAMARPPVKVKCRELPSRRDKMNFKKGADVIVSLGNNNTRTGKFVERRANNKLAISFSDFVELVEEFDEIVVRGYTPIDDEVTEKWCAEESPKIVELIQRSMSLMFPGYPYRLKIEDGSIDMDGFSLMPATLRVNSIARVREFPGYQLVSWKHHPATRFEPEDATDTVVSEHRTAMSAAEALIKISVANHIDRWFESESESQYAEEWE